MNNINYTRPEIEIVLFENEDIMTASNVGYDDGNIMEGGSQEWPWEN